MEIINALESDVRSYCRTWPVDFARAKGAMLIDTEGREYIDFFAGAGVLNYGHNHPQLKRALIDYLEDDGIVHSLDMATVAKERFLKRFDDVILKPRGLDYRVQFPGPTGTNAVEAALKLARKVTGRETIISFTNAFHGMTLGSLAVTGNEMKRRGAGVPLGNTVSMPYEDFLGGDVDTIVYLDAHLAGGSSGVDVPAAVIVETVQAEGGVHTASNEWLRALADLCERYDVLLIIDDIQAGCGRTGRFFSFEDAGLKPDIVCLSKSLSGFGLPMALTLLRPELDQWEPGEHNGTFRGHNPAFVTATEALSLYWSDSSLSDEVDRKGAIVSAALNDIAQLLPAESTEVRGRGLLRGLYVDIEGFADEVAKASFAQGLVHETSGPYSEVIKILPPLTIDDALLERGLAIIKESVKQVIKDRGIAHPALAASRS